MEDTKRFVAIGLCALVVLSLLADANAQCAINQLTPCESAALQGSQPSLECCNMLRSVDFNCFCGLVQRGNYPPGIINNAIHVPQKCGPAIYSMYKGKACAGYVIP